MLSKLESFSLLGIDALPVEIKVDVSRSGLPKTLLVGSGKTMLAKRVPTLLPDLWPSESIKTTGIHGAVARLRPGQPLLANRPFRSPQHTGRDAGLVARFDARPARSVWLTNGVLYLEEAAEIRPNHVSEAVNYRMLDRQLWTCGWVWYLTRDFRRSTMRHVIYLSTIVLIFGAFAVAAIAESGAYVHVVDVGTGLSYVTKRSESQRDPSTTPTAKDGESATTADSEARMRPRASQPTEYAQWYEHLTSFVFVAAWFVLFCYLNRVRSGREEDKKSILELADTDGEEQADAPVREAGEPIRDHVAKLYFHGDAMLHSRLHSFFITQAFTFAATFAAWGKPPLELTAIPLGLIFALVFWWALTRHDQSLAFLRFVLNKLSVVYRMQHSLHLPSESAMWNREEMNVPSRLWPWCVPIADTLRSSYVYLVWVIPGVVVYIWTLLLIFVVFHHFLGWV